MRIGIYPQVSEWNRKACARPSLTSAPNNHVRLQKTYFEVIVSVKRGRSRIVRTSNAQAFASDREKRTQWLLFVPIKVEVDTLLLQPDHDYSD